MGEPLLWVRRIKRDISLSGLQGSEQSGNHWRIVLEQERDSFRPFTALVEDFGSYAIGCLIQFFIGPFVISAFDGRLLRILCNLRRKAIGDRLLDLFFLKCSKGAVGTNAIAGPGILT